MRWPWLRDVVGLSPKELSDAAVELEFRADDKWLTCRVLPLLTLFQAKIANLATLEQTGRNDRKHVSILLLVVKEYLAELIRLAEAGQLEPRGAVVPMEHALRIVSSSNAEKCSTAHDIAFDQIWPRAGIEKATSGALRNFRTRRLPPLSTDR